MYNSITVEVSEPEYPLAASKPMGDMREYTMHNPLA